MRIRLEGLDPHDAAHRMSAYIYGNILVLAALAAMHPEQFQEGHATIVIIGTGLATYLAHCVAERQEHRVLHGQQTQEHELRKAFRNAVPILGSASIPTLLAFLASQLVIEAELAWHLAVIVIVVRLLSNGLVIARYRNEKVTFRTLWTGIVLAVVALSIAQLKATLTH